MNSKESDITKWDTLKDHARQMRREPTYCENIIWIALRDRRIKFKFRRQYVILPFIVDFVCLEKKLVIEIDGISHFGKEDYDCDRSRILEDKGYRILRFTDEEVTGKGE